MSELIFNQLAVTLPIHFFAYAPFTMHLRWGKRFTAMLVAAMETVYLLLFCLLLRAGFPITLAQAASVPIFGGLFFRSIKIEPGKIMFLYVFSLAYLSAVRGAAAFLERLLFGDSALFLYSWRCAMICLFLFVLTMPAMLWYLKRTARMVIETYAPQVWKRAWLLPLCNALIVLLFTYTPQSAEQINVQFLMARISLMLCMFISYYLVIQSVSQFQQRTAAEEQARYLKRLTDIQAGQYALLKSRIEETRQARHDLRQHLRAIQGYIEKGDLAALSSYVRICGENIPDEALHDYCRNHAVDSVLSFYAEKASETGIRMDISICPLPDTVIPEPAFCMLLGNLLENALDACRSIPGTPAITVRVRQPGSHMLAITVDNPCPAPPALTDGRFLSSKHEGFGNGTESVRSIAERYHGDARFEWRNGMFYASVMLNP